MSSRVAPIHAVLFDLDGTLLDTAPDLVLALNTLLKCHDKAVVNFDDVRNISSQGSLALTRYGFPEIEDDAEFEKLRQQFLQHYADSICVKSDLFNGMQELLNKIESQNIPWGIVTNKPDALTQPLLEKLSLSHRAACIISGDTLKVRKPHPEPLLTRKPNYWLIPT